MGTAITPLVLPAASGGDGGPYTYALNGPGGGPLPAGLGYSGSTRTLSGTPTAPGNWVLVYRISDSAGASLEVFFKVVVTAAAPSGTTPTLTTEDITLPEGEQAAFDVALSHAVTGGFTVTIGPQGSLEAGYFLSPTTLTFTGDAGEAQPFTVTSLPNAKVGDDVSVTLSFIAGGDAGGVVDDSDTAVLTIRDAEAGDAIAPAPVLSAVPGRTAAAPARSP